LILSIGLVAATAVLSVTDPAAVNTVVWIRAAGVLVLSLFSLRRAALASHRVRAGRGAESPRGVGSAGHRGQAGVAAVTGPVGISEGPHMVRAAAIMAGGETRSRRGSRCCTADSPWRVDRMVHGPCGGLVARVARSDPSSGRRRLCLRCGCGDVD
jgi:hypothetical protein